MVSIQRVQNLPAILKTQSFENILKPLVSIFKKSVGFLKY